MKIGFIEPGLHVCGGIRRIVETANRLISLNHEVIILTPQAKPCRWLPLQANVIGLHNLRDMSFDIIIFNLAEQYKHALITKAKKKVFWVLAPEALYKNPEIPTKALRQNFYLIVNSKFSRQYVQKRVPKLNYEPPIVHGGINPEHFKYDPEMPKMHNVLYYGSKRPWKGAHIIETALRGMSIKYLKMEGLNTPQEKMYTLYNSCDMYISAGEVEGFNFNILESMACGCPVITTDDGGNRDFVINEQNALVVPRQPIYIKQAIARLMSDKKLKRKLRENGLKTARDNKFNWDVVTKQFENILINLLKNKKL